MQYIKPNWPAPNHVKAFTTTRQQGKSLPPYSSFNIADHVGDDLNSVAANRTALFQDLHLPSQPRWLVQTHSNKAIGLTQITEELIADATFTHLSNTICVVMTADCLPILICDKKGTHVAAIHAGWRGLASGVIENTLTAMQLNPNELLVWLGPAIGPEAFEVGEDVFTTFTEDDPNCVQAFIQNRPKKWLANIYLLAQKKLNRYGITAIYGGNHCTYNEDKLFYSYRRDQGITGRMATLIWLSG